MKRVLNRSNLIILIVIVLVFGLAIGLDPSSAWYYKNGMWK